MNAGRRRDSNVGKFVDANGVVFVVLQIMQVHRDTNFLHIGCDEVYHLGECSRCRKKLKDELFLSHVSQVAKYIRKRYPYVVPIIWDDMLRHLPTTSLELFNIGRLVEPMVGARNFLLKKLDLEFFFS